MIGEKRCENHCVGEAGWYPEISCLSLSLLFIFTSRCYSVSDLELNYLIDGAALKFLECQKSCSN
jgi:hypothetical protein